MKLRKVLEENYKKVAFAIIVTLSIVVLLPLFSGNNLPDLGYTITDESIALVSHVESGESLELEVASSNQKRQQGLMNRTHLDRNKGMIFIFDKEQQLSFWMKDTSISLDIIFLNKDLKVISIYNNTKPEQISEFYNSKAAAQYVIETVAGWAQSQNVKNGDSFQITSVK